MALRCVPEMYRAGVAAEAVARSPHALRYLPAPQSGSPMTYTVGGKQYIVVAVSGGPYSGEYIAFRLPAAGAR